MASTDKPEDHPWETGSDPAPSGATAPNDGPVEPPAEIQIVLNNRALLTGFAILLAGFGAVFAAGYLAARWSGSHAAAPAPRPVSAAKEPPAQDLRRAPVEMEFARIRAGEFTMGFRRGKDDGLFEEIEENAGQLASDPDQSWFRELRAEITGDCPPHRVRITRPFELSRYEVSEYQWAAVMDPSDLAPDYSAGPDYPVANISWDDIQEFLQRLNRRRDGYRYRLPTEAEWEYCARAGSRGGDVDAMYLDAWDYLPGDRGISIARPVNIDTPNAWGLYNMLGNAAEWVADWYGSRYYRASRFADPQGPRHGARRVVRGGSREDVSFTVFVWSRSAEAPGEGIPQGGFRCARERVR
jgi:formylglycine-generating enzyme required for sulfatase activity